MYKCKYCGKEFERVSSLGGHVSCCKFNPNNKKPQVEKKFYKLFCKKCGKEYELELTENQFNSDKYSKFCSRSCSNSHIHSKDTKEKISNGVIKYFKEQNKTEQNIPNSSRSKFKKRICKVCGKEYFFNKEIFPNSTRIVCSKECREYYLSHKKEFLSSESIHKLSEAGKKSAKNQSEIRRSKNEKYFCKLCETYFNNVRHNESIFNGWDADIIIEDIKFAILWNGKWHYEKICKQHSVKQVQNRDKLKIDNIYSCGYIPYIIKDMGKFNKEFVENQFNIFLEFIQNKDILRIGETGIMAGS